VRSFVGRAADKIEGGIHHKGEVRGRVQYLSAVEMQLGVGLISCGFAPAGDYTIVW
jgi:hypothetical protein